VKVTIIEGNMRDLKTILGPLCVTTTNEQKELNENDENTECSKAGEDESDVDTIPEEAIPEEAIPASGE